MRLLQTIDDWLRRKPSRIYLGSLLLAVLPVGLFLLTAHQVLIKQITTRSKTQIQRSSANIAFVIEEHLAGSVTLVQALAGAPSVVKTAQSGDVAGLEQWLAERQRTVQRFRHLAVVSREGRVRAATPEGSFRAGEDVSTRDWFQHVSHGQQAYVSSLYSLRDGSLAITIASTIRSRGTAIGFLIAEESADTVTNSVFQLLTQNTDAVSFLDQAGQAMDKRQGRGLSLRSLRPEVMQTVRRSSPAGEADLVTMEGEQYLVAYSPVSSAGWGVAIQLPFRSIVDAVWIYEKNLALLGCFFIAIAFAVGTFIASLYKRLRDRERQTRAIVEGAQEAFLTLDQKGEIKEWNPEAEITFGRTREQMLGQPAFELFGHEGKQLLEKFMLESSHSRESVVMAKRLETSALRADGAPMAVEISLGFLALSRARIFTAFVRDISDRKEHLERIERQQRELALRNQEVEHANRMKSQFLASMSHDLRTPLNSILGFSELLAEQSIGELNEKQSRFVEHIRNAGRHLLDLINDVLDLSKIEAGQLQLARAPVALRSAFDQVQVDVQQQLRAKRLRLTAETPDVSVLADQTRLRQVLLNLLSNAIKFTPEGGDITLTARAGGPLVEIAVTDTGIGIAPEHQVSIFQEFHQVGTSTKGITEGSGLGLAIVKRLVEQHGGSITLTSALGAGSTFVFTIPSASVEVGEGSHPVPISIKNGKPLVLIVDDEPVAQELLVRYLSSDGYSTEVASSARAAIDRVRVHPPDAITLDIMMAGTSGWETLHLLKSDPATSHIPVIVVSIVDERQMGVLLGADEYFVKPVDRPALLHALQRVLGPQPQVNRSCLIVDDDPSARTLVAEVVCSLGCRAVETESGEQALQLLESETPDAVVLDLVMPGIHGIEVLERMRSNPRLARLPVIILTAKDITNADSIAIQQQAQAFLRKAPDWQRQLSHALRKVFRESAATLAGGTV